MIVDCIAFSYSEGARLAPTNTFRTSIANFQLIVEHPILHSEGEYIYSLDYEGVGATPNYSSQLIVDSIVDGISKPTQLIVESKHSKRFVHFCKDCGIFCEGEWEQPRHLDGYTGIIGHRLIVNLIGHFVSLIDFIGLNNLISLMGFIGLTGLVGLIDLIKLFKISELIVKYPIGIINYNGLINLMTSLNHWLTGLLGFISLNGLSNISGFGGFSLVGRVGFINLVGLIDLVGLIGLIGLDDISLRNLGISFISIGDFVCLFSLGGLTSGISLIGRIGRNGLIGIIGLVGLVGRNGLIDFFGFGGLIGLISFIGLNSLIGIRCISCWRSLLSILVLILTLVSAG